MTSQYYGVHICTAKVHGRPSKIWIAKITDRGTTWRRKCANEREAAISVDKRLIELGRAPVNILKPKL
jgi:photosystem II stability/assembly factor-like uncharacterized protein